jgi:hypothetical protein
VAAVVALAQGLFLVELRNWTVRPIIRLKENAPEFDYSSFYVTTGTGTSGALSRGKW